MQTQSELPEKLQPDHPTTAILRRIWERLNKNNEHFMGVVVGREGSGKSFTAIKIANMVDPAFSAEKVIFEPERLLQILRDETYTPGDVYVFDEAGVGLGNRTWNDSSQVKFNQALQLIRSHNIGLLFTLPRLGELDTQAEGRLIAYFELCSKEPDEYVRGRWRWLDPDRVDMTGKIYRKRPTYKGHKVNTIAFTPPECEDVVQEYEKQKKEFQKRFYEETLEEMDDEQDEEGLSVEDVVEDIQDGDGHETYLRDINDGAQIVLDKDLIAGDYPSLSVRDVQTVKKMLLRDIDRDDVL